MDWNMPPIQPKSQTPLLELDQGSPPSTRAEGGVGSFLEGIWGSLWGLSEMLLEGINRKPNSV